jgi:hypothetical protein
MSAIAFDTHAFVKRLTAAGMPEPQAEALADEQRRLIDDRLATKADLEALHAELKRDLAELELRQTIRLGGMMAASIAVVAALVKLL